MTVAKEMVAECSSHQFYWWFADEILDRGDQKCQADGAPCCLEI